MITPTLEEARGDAATDSGITLEIKEVRVQRLQDISWQDARAEGVSPAWIPGHDIDIDGQLWAGAEEKYRTCYADLWNHINAGPKPVKVKGQITHYVSYPWEDTRETREHRGKPWHVIGNCWVWVIGFERHQP